MRKIKARTIDKILLMLLTILSVCLIKETPAQAAGFDDYTAISSPQDLADIVNDPDGKYYLTNNIDMGSYGLWTPLDFTGVLDGNGKKISNLTITSHNNGNVGLFASVCDANINNLTVQVNIEIVDEGNTNTFYIGGIAGRVNDSSMAKCTVMGSINISSKNKLENTQANYDDFYRTTNVYTGGIAGLVVSSDVKRCYNSAAINVNVDNQIIVKNSGAYIYNNSYVGGIIGRSSNCMVEKLLNKGTINLTGNNYTSHWCGQFKEAEIHGGSYTGGIFGLFDGHNASASNIQNIGNVSCRCSNYCNVRDDKYATIDYKTNCGGIAGRLSAKLLYACNTGSVTGNGAGAIVGYADSTAFCNYTYYLMNEDNSLQGTANGITSSCLTKGLNKSGFQKEKWFKNLDFEKLWTIEKGINNGYPMLTYFRSQFQVPKVTCSKKAGTYSEEIIVELSTPVNGAQIYYTTDGKNPTTNSKKYDKALTFKKTTTLKVIVVKQGYKRSNVSTFKYIIK